MYSCLDIIILCHYILFLYKKRITNNINILDMDEIKIGAEIVFNITGNHNIGYAKREGISGRC